MHPIILKIYHSSRDIKQPSMNGFNFLNWSFSIGPHIQFIDDSTGWLVMLYENPLSFNCLWASVCKIKSKDYKLKSIFYEFMNILSDIVYE